jgi:hypothetical protein
LPDCRGGSSLIGVKGSTIDGMCHMLSASRHAERVTGGGVRGGKP